MYISFRKSLSTVCGRQSLRNPQKYMHNISEDSKVLSHNRFSM
jgi:hypothetical protein